jgi:hypothetical protein
MRFLNVMTFMLVAIALLNAGCQRSGPLDPNGSQGRGATSSVLAQPGGLVAYGIIENQDSQTLFSPLTRADYLTKWGGIIEYQCGGTGGVYVNKNYKSQMLLANIGREYVNSGSYGFQPKNTSINIMEDIIFLRYNLGGVGGLTGDPAIDPYLCWEGRKFGGNTSLDYANISVYFNAVRSPHPSLDLRKYKGFTFYAKGTGNFGVGLIAGANGGPPYMDYNVYEKMFSDQLAGPDKWRQIVVYFTDMQQMFLGKGYADLDAVLAEAVGLQFQQESPVTTDFRLDLDYIRFFR